MGNLHHDPPPEFGMRHQTKNTDQRKGSKPREKRARRQHTLGYLGTALGAAERRAFAHIQPLNAAPSPRTPTGV